MKFTERKKMICITLDTSIVKAIDNIVKINQTADTRITRSSVINGMIKSYMEMVSCHHDEKNSA